VIVLLDAEDEVAAGRPEYPGCGEHWGSERLR
jgi:hypothetical protein